MKELKDGDIVISPISHSYLTEGKEYVIKAIGYSDSGAFYFSIVNDRGFRTSGTVRNSAHLRGRDWIVKGE